MPDGSNIENLADADERKIVPAMLRGWRRRCPSCGGGPLFTGYSTVRPTCAACGEELHHHRADDLPAWATILIVGHVLVSGILTVEMRWEPPLWVHWSLWPALTLLMVLWLLPRIKGAVVGWQWAARLHGFDRSGPGQDTLEGDGPASATPKGD